jgi:hypothetical protein
MDKLLCRWADQSPLHNLAWLHRHHIAASPQSIYGLNQLFKKLKKAWRFDVFCQTLFGIHSGMSMLKMHVLGKNVMERKA